MKNKIMTAKAALAPIKSGDTVMTGGFFDGGSPEFLFKNMEGHSARNLTLITNDSGMDGRGIDKYMHSVDGMISKVYINYIGRSSAVQRMLKENPDSVVLVPQGNFAEKLRAGGCGIPAFYTPVGVGTVIEDGKEYILETAFHADVALVHAHKVDEYGNCYMRRAAKNFNTLMAMAADYVVVEAEEIVPIGSIDPDLISVPGAFISAIVKIESEAN
ncbi:MAG: CoA transferase subunit A [Clostridia bacterium]|nr:CoA transferase subunit A [Clostridia bacterium]